MVKTSASSYKERSTEKQLVILFTHKMNVKCIKLDQMISHSPNKWDCQRIMTEEIRVEKEMQRSRAIAITKPGTNTGDTVQWKTDESAHLCGLSM